MVDVCSNGRRSPGVRSLLVVLLSFVTACVPAVGGGTAEGGRLIAVGDSIMLGAKAELGARASFLGWPSLLDMEVSRSTAAGADALAGHSPGPLDTVVISLGANDSGDVTLFRSRVRRVLDAASAAARVYWLTIPEVRPYYPNANGVIREEIAAHPNMAIIDWAAVARDAPGLTARDGLHLKPEGTRVMADTIVAAILGDGGAGEPAESSTVPEGPAAVAAPEDDTTGSVPAAGATVPTAGATVATSEPVVTDAIRAEPATAVPAEEAAGAGAPGWMLIGGPVVVVALVWVLMARRTGRTEPDRTEKSSQEQKT